MEKKKTVQRALPPNRYNFFNFFIRCKWMTLSIGRWAERYQLQAQIGQRQFRQIFADNVEFEIDEVAGLEVLKIGVFKGVWNDGNGKPIFGRLHHRQTDAVDTNRAFVHQNPALAGRIFQLEIPAPVPVFDSGHDTCRIHMPLYDVPVQTSVRRHRAFEIDHFSNCPSLQIGAFQRFLDRSNGMRPIFQSDHRQADAVVAQTLVYFQGIG